jgi:hypothetical protein
VGDLEHRERRDPSGQAREPHERDSDSEGGDAADKRRDCDRRNVAGGGAQEVRAGSA